MGFNIYDYKTMDEIPEEQRKSVRLGHQITDQLIDQGVPPYAIASAYLNALSYLMMGLGDKMRTEIIEALERSSFHLKHADWEKLRRMNMEAQN